MRSTTTASSKRHAHVSAVEWSMLYGLASGVIALAVGAVALALHHAGPAAGAPARDWPRFWLVCLLLALGASVIGNYLWNLASRLVPVTLSGQLILSETLFALLYGYLYAQRMPRPLEWAAMLLLRRACCGPCMRMRARKGAGGLRGRGRKAQFCLPFCSCQSYNHAHLLATGEFRLQLPIRYPNMPQLLLKARDSLLQHFRPILNHFGVTEQQWRIMRAPE
jgi:hypothetical protein